MGDLIFRKGQKVLFIGDSITDSGRREQAYTQLGYGYFLFASSVIQARYPELDLVFENRGIGGNTLLDLQARWETDCIAEQPDWLSCLIGINDASCVWRRRPGYERLTADEYLTNYRELLRQVREQTPARVILWQPFLISTDHDLARYQGVKLYIAAVDQLAGEFDAILIRAQSVFDEACKKRSPEFWAHDGVHPSKPGHALMAEAFLKAVGA